MANASTQCSVAALILAAGSASRMGTMKVLLPWRGQPLIRHVAEVALAARISDVVVVTGNEASAVAQAVADLPLRIVHNVHYRDGLSGSLRAGIAALDTSVDAVLVLLADQPLLTAAVVDRLIERYVEGDARIVAPFADGQRGNPVLFDRALFPELLQIEGDQGARSVLRAHRDEIAGVEVAANVLEDVDTPEAYEALLARDGTTPS